MYSFIKMGLPQKSTVNNMLCVSQGDISSSAGSSANCKVFKNCVVWLSDNTNH